jgi:hypothetical protein
MTNEPLPFWLRNSREAFAEVKVAKRDQALSCLVVKAEGETFWSAVCSELELVSRNLPEELRCQFYHAPSESSRHEDHCRLGISYVCSSPRNSYTDLWYQRGHDRIRFRSVPGGEESYLALCVIDGKIGAMDRDGSKIMDAESVAGFIAKPMFDYVQVAALA